MPCRPEEQFAQGPEPEHPVTPTKPSGKHGASHADPDAEDADRRSDEEEVLGAKKSRPSRHVLQYEVVKRWVTGDRAEKDEDEIQRELDVLRRELIELSCQRKVFVYKLLDTDKGFWKLRRLHNDKRASNMARIGFQ